MTERQQQKAYLIPLDDQDLIRVTGEDSEKFLQGQLSCDVATLAERHSSLGCICNVQGRVISVFRILRHGEDWFLAMPGGMGDIARDHLSRFAVFFKTELNHDDSFRRIGLCGSDIIALLEDQFGTLPAPGDTISTGDGRYLVNTGEVDGIPRFELWAPSAAMTAQIEALHRTGIAVATAADWQRLAILAGEVLPGPAQSALFTPEELNLDLGDAVSFSKGCYTGQEVVARMHYRGKGRKRLARFSCDDALPEDQALPVPDEELSLRIPDNDRQALPVVALARDRNNLTGLAVAHLDRLPDTAQLTLPGGVTVSVSLTPAS